MTATEIWLNIADNEAQNTIFVTHNHLSKIACQIKTNGYYIDNMCLSIELCFVKAAIIQNLAPFTNTNVYYLDMLHVHIAMLYSVL